VTDSQSQTHVISTELAVKLKRLLDRYAMAETYTYRERTGGVLQGCPRGPQITPARLALNVKIIRDAFDSEVKFT